MPPVLLEPVYVLHRRPYRETSFLLELFSLNHGRVGAIVKGVRKARSSLPGLLQPFTPLYVSWSGKGELMSLRDAEIRGEIVPLKGENIYAGFYLNELLLILLTKWDPHPQLFSIYEQTLRELRQSPFQEHYLRSFELRLLQEIGYGLLPKAANSLHNTFESQCYYHFSPETGFTAVRNAQSNARGVFLGQHLNHIANEAWHEPAILQDAKRLVRHVLTPLLGKRQLYSRHLYMMPSKEENNNDNH